MTPTAATPCAPLDGGLGELLDAGDGEGDRLAAGEGDAAAPGDGDGDARGVTTPGSAPAPADRLTGTAVGVAVALSAVALPGRMAPMAVVALLVRLEAGAPGEGVGARRAAVTLVPRA